MGEAVLDIPEELSFLFSFSFLQLGNLKYESAGGYVDCNTFISVSRRGILTCHVNEN